MECLGRDEDGESGWPGMTSGTSPTLAQGVRPGLLKNGPPKSMTDRQRRSPEALAEQKEVQPAMMARYFLLCLNP